MQYVNNREQLNILSYDNFKSDNDVENTFLNSNVLSKKLDLDHNSKAQLTLKYIKSNSKSEWSELDKKLEFAYNTKNIDLIEELIETYSKQLTLDEEALKEGRPVSDFGLFAKRVNSTFNRADRPIRFANKIAEKLYLNVVDGKTKARAENLTHAITIYSQVISKLTNKYIENYTEQYIMNNKLKLNRMLEHNRGNFCLLKNKPLSNAVLEPTAMPVNISPFNELEEFFNFLDSNGEVVVNEEGQDPCMKFTRGAIYEDMRMDLCKQVVGPTWIGKLMNSLKSNSKVSHFLLGNNIIGEEGGRAIKEFLLNPHVPKIQTWYIAGNDLNANAISNIVDGLENDPDMNYLWLKRNPIKSEGMVHIARLLKNNQRIKILDLHNTAILDKGIKYLVEGLKENKSLRYLYLDVNALTEISVNDLIDYFEHLILNDIIGVTSLWIDMNKLFDNGVSRLVKVLGKYKHLKRLFLGSNGLTEACINDIVDAFINHPNLIILDLGMYKSTSDMGMITNNIGDLGASRLCRLIENNKKIIYLNVMMNGLTEQGLECLAKSIEQNNSLLYFEYKQYGVHTPENVDKIVKNKLEANWKLCQEQGIPIVPLRILKHGKNIRLIDSIYRNSMK